MIVVDISPSMNATDVAPSRLAHARFEIMDLLRRFKEGQTGLIAYATEPYVVSPLTGDARTIEAQVPSLSTDLLPVQGPKHTHLALQQAGRLLRQGGSTQGQVILLTDALEQPAAALEAARELRSQGYRLSVLGIGSAGGAPVPLPEGGFLNGSDGAPQLAKLDSETLQSLAAAGGGRYLTATMDDRDVEGLIRDAPSPGSGTADATATTADQWREEGPWLLLALLPLAAAAFRRGWLSPLLVVLLIAPAPPADAFGWSDLWARPDQQAARLLEQGQAQEAAQNFQRRDWRAAAAYQAGDYQHALDSLTDMQAQDAWYNRGNALARLGSYQDALAAYDRALEKDPDDADARHNRDLVRQLLEQQQRNPSQSEQSEQSKQRQDAGAGDGASQQQQAQAGQQSDQQNPEAGSDTGTDSQAGATDQSQAQTGETQPPGEQGEQNNPSQSAEEADSQAAATKPFSESQQDAAKTGSAKADEDQNQADASAQQRAETAGTETPDGERAGQPAEHTPQASAAAGKNEDGIAHGGAEPSAADLQGNNEQREARTGPNDAAGDLPMTEAQQAMEHQLNRIPDDPAGLLRQRFLLQHMRRNGQL